jgi:hypothetical protein
LSCGSPARPRARGWLWYWLSKPGVFCEVSGVRLRGQFIHRPAALLVADHEADPESVGRRFLLSCGQRSVASERSTPSCSGRPGSVRSGHESRVVATRRTKGQMNSKTPEPRPSVGSL